MKRNCASFSLLIMSTLRGSARLLISEVRQGHRPFCLFECLQLIQFIEEKRSWPVGNRKTFNPEFQIRNGQLISQLLKEQLLRRARTEMFIPLIEADTSGLAPNQRVAGIKSTPQTDLVGSAVVLPLNARRLRFIVVAHIHPATELPVRKFFAAGSAEPSYCSRSLAQGCCRLEALP